MPEKGVTLHWAAALPMANVVWASLAVWLASPAKAAETVAVPAWTLPAYSTGTAVSRPPAPVALAEQGVWPAPVYVKGPAPQVIVVVEPALPIAKVEDALLGVWFASPAYEALAVAVPTAVLAE